MPILFAGVPLIPFRMPGLRLQDEYGYNQQGTIDLLISCSRQNHSTAGRETLMDLGVVVTINNPAESEAQFTKAREAGFSFGQVNFSWHGIAPESVREVALAAKQQGFRAIAAGCPINPLRLNEDLLMNVDEKDFVRVVENMAMLDNCQRVVFWSGTYARQWMEPNLLNQEQDAYFALVVEIKRLQGRVSGIPCIFAIQPYFTHILHDARACQRLIDDFPDGSVRLAFNPAYLITPSVYSHRATVLQTVISSLAPLADIAYLSDTYLRDDNSFNYPLPGQGALQFVPIVKALNENLAKDTPILLQPPAPLSVASLKASENFIAEAASKAGAV